MSELYQVRTYEVLQMMPAPAGVRAVFKDQPENYVCAIVAMAVCRVREDWYRDGKMVRRGEVYREACGLMTSHDMGFDACEQSSNFEGYLAPGEEP